MRGDCSMSWDKLNDDVRGLIFKMKTEMEIEDKFKKEHSKKMAEAFDLIKIRRNRIDFEERCIKYNCDDKYCRMFYDYEFEKYLMKYGETRDYEDYKELGDSWAVFMHIYCGLLSNLSMEIN